MGRFQSLLSATGGERSRHSRLGKWFEVMSRYRDGDTSLQNAKPRSLAKSLGGQISLSSPMGQAILRMSAKTGTPGPAPIPVNAEATAVEGNRRPTAVWFNDGHTPAAPLA